MAERKDLEAALAVAHRQAAAAYDALEELVEVVVILAVLLHDGDAQDEQAEVEAARAARAKKPVRKKGALALYWNCGKCKANYTEDESAMK